jgi:predicted esterase
MTNDPHGSQPVLHLGPELADARLAAILVHGRGASAEDILSVAHELALPDIAYFAPQAAGHTWYPYSFLAPIPQNEPWISSGLKKINDLIETFRREGVDADRVVLLGFSQGACLSLEFAARHAQRYAAVIGFSGGLIGPPGTPRQYTGSMDGTPVFLGCSDVDPHIPLERVLETAEVFQRLGARVDKRIYPGMGHLINHDELDAVRAMLRDAAVVNADKDSRR